MKEPTPTTTAGEPEETLVTPRFDEVETVQAQPVVPLAEVPPGASRGRRFGASRVASWPLALVLLSALVGVVVGGAGLYFYQHRLLQNAAADTQTTPDASEATPATSAEESASAPQQEPAPGDEQTDAAEVVSAEIVEPDAPAVADDNPKKEEADKSPAPEPRKAAERGDADDDNTGPSKRGREGERDEEAVRRTPRAERVGSRESARDDDGGQPEARLSDEIIYRRERRAERRAERRERRENRQRSVDRVRGIFEGQPE